MPPPPLTHLLAQCARERLGVIIGNRCDQDTPQLFKRPHLILPQTLKQQQKKEGKKRFTYYMLLYLMVFSANVGIRRRQSSQFA